MKTRISFCILPLVILLAATATLGQELIVNGQQVTEAELATLKERLGLPVEAAIPPGRYWYDDISGLWGIEGGPMQGQILPGIEIGGELHPDASGGAGTGVFVNGRELHPQEVAYLQGIFGYVLPGRYWMDWQGIGGYEGGPAQFNLAAAAQAAGAGGVYGGYTRRTPFGSIGGDGNCSYFMSPGGSSVMTC